MKAHGLVLLLVATLVPAPAAAVGGGVVIEGDEVWDSGPKIVNDVTIQTGASLTIRGIAVRFLDNAKLLVEPGARLLVESTSSAHASLSADGFGFWQARSLGTVELVGTRLRPVFVQSVGGSASLGGTPESVAAAIDGGFVSGGPGSSLLARHVVFLDYTAGLNFGREAKATVEDADFDSRMTSLAVVVSRGDLALSNVSFRGAGGGIFATLSNLTVSNASFLDVPRAITVTNTRARFDRLTVANATQCVGAFLASQVTARGLVCRDFATGVEITTNQPRDRPLLDLSDYVADTHRAGAVAITAKDANVTVADAEITGAHFGVRAGGVAPRLVNVSFHAIQGYNLVLENPPAGFVYEPLLGEPGALGWFAAAAETRFRVEGPGGLKQPGARLKIYRLDDATVVTRAVAREDGTASVVLESRRVEADGTHRPIVYRALVEDRWGELAAIHDFAPTGDEVRVTLAPPRPKATPFSGLLSALAAVAVGATFASRRR